MTIQVNDLEYDYENLGGGVYRIMVNAESGDQPGWHHVGRVKSENIADLPAAIAKASSAGWPYVARPFAAELKQARAHAGLSQAQAADLLAVTPQTVKNWEAGRREPPAEPILTQADILKRLTESSQ